MTVPVSARTWAEIDLGAIRHNVALVRERVGPEPEIAAVVKANAYGHGALEVAHAIRDQVGFFAVANAEEADPIAPLGRDILLLGPCLPDERRAVVENGWIATVSGAREAAGFSGGRVTLKVDTGMGRIGCWHEDALAEVARILALPDVILHGIATHLPSADDDPAFTLGQLEQFASLAREFRRVAPGARLHALNSAGILEFPGHAHNLVRPGLMLYGSACPARHQGLLRPALAWKTRILQVRDLPAGRSLSYGRTHVTARPTRVATLAVGYADGFPRQASNRGAQVLVGGRRCPVLGRVTMDQILADVTAVDRLSPGDEAVLVGRQGNEDIRAAELAGWSDTIAWHVFTGLGHRVKRLYRSA